MKFAKPTILVSRCIEFEACRYDQSKISSGFVKRLKDYVEIITACPEVAIGLPVPREAIRLIEPEEGIIRLVESIHGGDVTDKMVEYTEEKAMEMKQAGIHGAILKSRSPSCGIKDVKVYKDYGKSPTIPKKVAGIFGGGMIEALPGLPIEDEGRLTNYAIREHFLTRIFTLADFDLVKEEPTMKKLVDFQSRYKYLLMAYHQSHQKKMGAVVANHKHLPMDQVMVQYEELLKKALAKPLHPGRNTNMLLHIFGYFSNELSAQEKAYFLDMLESYNQHKIPFSVPLGVLRAWVIRFNEPYLMTQRIFEPYPKEILDVTDSGKGVD